MRSIPRFLLLVVLLGSGWCPARAATYYVANDGSDAKAGTSPDAPWRTVARVNTFALAPGDVVLLRRGDRWPEQLVPHSGSEAGRVTYGAYGSGEKPLLLGSVNKSKPGDWRHEGGNLWVCGESVPRGPSLLGNPSFSENDARWLLHTEQGAAAVAGRDASEFDSAPAGCRVRCANPGKSGSHVQLYTGGIPVARGKLYRLVFRARASEPFVLRSPKLMRGSPPWADYSRGPRERENRIGKTWDSCTQYYWAGADDPEARLTFFLGGALPAGATLYLDSLRFEEVSGDDALFCDVGNTIFNREGVCGVKVFNESELKEQGQYWYDEDRCLVKLYSIRSPAEYYSDIECALRRHIIDQSTASYVVYDGLALKYGAAHGIGGHDTHHITTRNCDFAYLGGGDQMGGEATVRFGNGVEYWGNAHDNLVENCRFWEIYDAAMTNQNQGATVEQFNLVYRNNVVWNCEYSFEYWNRPDESSTHDVTFENNTCASAGGGWGHGQRPDPGGRHLCFYASPAKARDIHIRNNVFYQATDNALFFHHWSETAIRALDMAGNCWYQRQGVIIRLIGPGGGEAYPMDRFSAFQAKYGFGAGSMATDPRMVDPARGDFRLAPDSPCPAAGAMPVKRE